MLQAGPQIYHGFAFLLSPTTDLDLYPMYSQPGGPTFLPVLNSSHTFLFSACLVLLSPPGLSVLCPLLTKSCIDFRPLVTYQALLTVFEAT